MSILERVEVNRVPAEVPPIKWLIEGPAKTGKSTYAMSWPKPLFLDLPAERGIWHLPGISTIKILRWSDLETLGKELGTGAVPYQTIVIDTIDAMWNLCHQDKKQGKKLWQSDYSDLYAEFLPVLTRFNSLGLHVVMVSHIKALTREVVDEATGKKGKVIDKYVNKLPGGLSQEVSGTAGHILHTGIDDKDKFMIRCSGTKLYEAGGRIGGLPPALYLNPGDSLFAAIEKAYRSTIKPANGVGRRTMAVNPIKLKAKEQGFSGDTVALWLKFRGIHDGILESAPDSILTELTELLKDKDKATVAFEDARVEIALSAQEQPKT